GGAVDTRLARLQRFSAVGVDRDRAAGWYDRYARRARAAEKRNGQRRQAVQRRRYLPAAHRFRPRALADPGQGTDGRRSRAVHAEGNRLPAGQPVPAANQLIKLQEPAMRASSQMFIELAE